MSWQEKMREAVSEMLASEPYASKISTDHTERTPVRVVKAFEESLSGCFIDASEILQQAAFRAPAGDSEMVHVNEVPFYSVCAHHLVSFVGKAWFAYVPSDKIVGLSKIPRFIDVLARRPQVQENLTEQIVDTFMRAVSPSGCGVVLRAYHFCMICRGAKVANSYTTTTALRGGFRVPHVKNEFLTEAAVMGGVKIWP